MSNISEREWSIAESKAEEYKNKISAYFSESIVSSKDRYVKVEVLIPLTENINQTFEFDAPYEYMDADNSTLKKYFSEHICPIEPVDLLDSIIE